MTEIWPIQTLRDLQVQILDCEHKTPKPSSVGRFPYVAIPDIVDGRIRIDDCRLISDEDFLEWTKRTRPVAGDIIITRRGRVGDTAPVPSEFECAIGQNLVIARPNNGLLNPNFFRWAVRGPIWRSEVDRLTNVGAIFSSLNVRDISNLRIPSPPIPEQTAIASILDSIEDKISLNQDIIKTADKFINGHFQAISRPIPFSDLRFSDVASVGGGGTPSTFKSEFWEGRIPWATPTDVTALSAGYLWKTGRTITELGLSNCSSQLYPAGSILMTSRATIGAFALTQTPMAVNQGFIVVNAKEDVHQLWLYHEMRSRVEEFKSHANGATFLELSRGRFKNLPVRMGDLQTMESFNTLAVASHARASHAYLEAAHLANLRDALLPSLISGRLRVRDAEQQAEGIL